MELVNFTKTKKCAAWGQDSIHPFRWQLWELLCLSNFFEQSYPYDNIYSHHQRMLQEKNAIRSRLVRCSALAQVEQGV
jgi:hypothetical protein